MNLKQKLQLQEENESKIKLSQIVEEFERVIVNIKNWIGEAKRIEEEIKKRENFESLEFEIVPLRNELENTIAKSNRSLEFEKSTKILDDIINGQRSPFIKKGLGYEEK